MRSLLADPAWFTGARRVRIRRNSFADYSIVVQSEVFVPEANNYHSWWYTIELPLEKRHKIASTRWGADFAALRLSKINGGLEIVEESYRA